MGAWSFYNSAYNKGVHAVTVRSDYLTTVIIAEMLHRRMMAEAIAKGLVPPGQPLKKLNANPHVITALSDYITEVEKLLQLPLIVHDITAADIAASHSRHGLFVNDSLNLACALRRGLTNIVTHDTVLSPAED